MHTSNLANAQFLQPGSAVFEIIQRNWFWHGLDRSFQVRRPWAAATEWCAAAGVRGLEASPQTSPNAGPPNACLMRHPVALLACTHPPCRSRQR